MARGGARSGAGRKKKQATILKELAIKHANGEAEKSLRFLVQMRDDAKNAPGVRLAAAEGIMDRVWGKAKQSIAASGFGHRVVVVRPDPIKRAA